MKAPEFNFKWVSSTPLQKWMSKREIDTLHVEEIEGIRFAVSKNGYAIMLASTVPGLCDDLQVCIVQNKRHKHFPGEYLLITWAPYANRNQKCNNSFTARKYGRRGYKRDYSLSA